MATRLRLEYDGQEWGDGGNVDLGRIHDNETKTIKLKIINEGADDAENIQFETNLPKPAYTADVPGDVPGKSFRYLTIKVKGGPLFDAKIPKITMGLKYTLVRRYT